jgi:hypothetical protein
VGEETEIRKARQAGALRRERAKLLGQENPKTHGNLRRKVEREQSVKGERMGGDAPYASTDRGRSLRGQKAHESKRSRPKLIPSGQKGHGFLSGIKPLKQRGKVVTFCSKLQERKERFARTSRSSCRSKALKSEAQECWGLKEIPEDGEIRPSHREGSQTLV